MKGILLLTVAMSLCMASVPVWAADSEFLGTWKGQFVGSASSGMVGTTLSVKAVDFEKKTAAVKFYKDKLARSPYPLELEQEAILVDEKTIKLDLKEALFTYTLLSDGTLKATRASHYADGTWTSIMKKAE